MGHMTLDAANPFAAPSMLPYELPDYTAVREEHYEPALRAGMAEQRAEVEAIATNAEPATVENTLEAFERSGRLLRRTLQAFHNQVSADATPGLEDAYERLSPEYAAHRDAIYMDGRLYARLRTLADAAEAGDLTLEPDTAWLLRTMLKDFRRSGIDLDADQQATLRDLNARITELEAVFARKLLAGEKASAVLITDVAELEGLPDDAIAGAAASASARGHDGQWLIDLQLPTQQNVVGSLVRRDVRERVQRASESRGAHGDDNDTRATLLEIV